ncbi:GNAT family N-acetyltransferase [Streptomyces sp. SID3343]|nr:GNAT family N-acetyltransferase [Streptomyces sp. SID3343]
MERGSPVVGKDVVRAWVDGWVLSRSVPAAVEIPGGFRIDVGEPGHVVRYVLFDIARVRELAVGRADGGTWIKTAAPAEVVVPALTPAWTVNDPEFLMSTPLRRGVTAVPSGYTVHTEERGGVTVVRVRAADGSVAAGGRIARTGSTAVVDVVSTEPAHRRRGLGAVVTTALTDAAAQAGAETAVLVATAQGRALYRSLGWESRSEITPAFVA